MPSIDLFLNSTIQKCRRNGGNFPCASYNMQFFCCFLRHVPIKGAGWVRLSKLRGSDICVYTAPLLGETGTSSGGSGGLFSWQDNTSASIQTAHADQQNHCMLGATLLRWPEQILSSEKIFFTSELLLRHYGIDSNKMSWDALSECLYIINSSPLLAPC